MGPDQAARQPFAACDTGNNEVDSTKHAHAKESVKSEYLVAVAGKAELGVAYRRRVGKNDPEHGEGQ